MHLAVASEVQGLAADWRVMQPSDMCGKALLPGCYPSSLGLSVSPHACVQVFLLGTVCVRVLCSGLVLRPSSSHQMPGHALEKYDSISDD